MNAKEQLYKALIECEELKTLLPDREEGIYKDIAPSGGEYPQIVYSLVSDIPKLGADDQEKLHKTTLQISVITENGKYGEIEKTIKKVMSSKEYLREYSGEIYEEGKKIKIMRYVILEEEE